MIETDHGAPHFDGDRSQGQWRNVQPVVYDALHFLDTVARRHTTLLRTLNNHVADLARAVDSVQCRLQALEQEKSSNPSEIKASNVKELNDDLIVQAVESAVAPIYDTLLSKVQSMLIQQEKLAHDSQVISTKADCLKEESRNAIALFRREISSKVDSAMDAAREACVLSHSIFDLWHQRGSSCGIPGQSDRPSPAPKIPSESEDIAHSELMSRIRQLEEELITMKNKLYSIGESSCEKTLKFFWDKDSQASRPLQCTGTEDKAIPWFPIPKCQSMEILHIEDPTTVHDPWLNAHRASIVPGLSRHLFLLRKNVGPSVEYLPIQVNCFLLCHSSSSARSLPSIGALVNGRTIALPTRVRENPISHGRYHSHKMVTVSCQKEVIYVPIPSMVSILLLGGSSDLVCNAHLEIKSFVP